MTSTRRLLSLDIFRGITIAMMILVNCPGSAHPYPWLMHTDWHGCRIADLVFPFFIFILGVSSVFSITYALEQGTSSRALLVKITKRSVILFSIGLFLNAFPWHFDLATLRIFGVLQRIALCYFASAYMYVLTRLQTQGLLILLLLVGYYVVMCFYPLPGMDGQQLSPQGNLAAHIDRFILSPTHMYNKNFDPEGLLSTLPAIATALLGNLAGVWLLQPTKNALKAQALWWVGILFLTVGWFWGWFFPINKALWTSSYVLYSGGMALLLFALCYWLIDIRHTRRWAKPFEILGLNATAAYVLHVFFFKLQCAVFVVNSENIQMNLRDYIAVKTFGFASEANAALLYAASYTLIWLMVMTLLYRRKIFIRL